MVLFPTAMKPVSAMTGTGGEELSAGGFGDIKDPSLAGALHHLGDVEPATSSAADWQNALQIAAKR
jgi:hypothetical protein